MATPEILAINCPVIVCGPASLIPIPGLPSPSDVVGSALNAIVKAFTGDPKENLKWAMDAITSTPVANLRLQAFQQLYGTMFALIIIISFMAMMWTITTMLLRVRSKDPDASIATVLPSAGIVLLLGVTLPGIVTMCLMGTQAVAKQLEKVFTHLHGGQSLNLPSVGDNISDMFVSIEVMMERIVLTMLAEPIELGVYLFTIVALLSLVNFVTNNGVVGNFTRWALAGLATGIFLQPVVVVVLGLGSWAANAAGNDRASALVIMFTLLVAIIIPFAILWKVKKHIDTAVKNREMRIRGDVNARQQLTETQQKRDAQHGVNAHLNAMRNNPATATPGEKSRHGLLTSAVLIGTGAAVEAKAVGVATKLAANGHHFRAAAVHETHRRYFSPEASAARAQKREAPRSQPTQPPPAPRPPVATAPSSRPPVVPPPSASQRSTPKKRR